MEYHDTSTRMIELGMRISNVGEEWSHQDAPSLLVGKSGGTTLAETLVVFPKVTFHFSWDPTTDSTLS